ncbi:heterogeneous nuclear ribonucleoprotein M isoform X1 [Salmo salar]|uniref:Heterogeneous nuclear ribonucleoprotein M isoform X1 n=2 Tax=Salmo salar TaxID=8030 RepID=A0A1S3MM80_SALSA|nr:heterogeneous nuclear ribonucleoprotein M isoform X1 [Salmo salar]XP_029551854.1 heterogeneous nuclear ribonucleoprotein M-like isoform X1 [Salmo trutta]XP_029551855.1 heterogeneous nuclear ribonucleoprotein M-like isoform X1 [Salmo trutta]|eukprot:XP_014004195.1 PREDICTED: heterogeneous nuclear ribonucleoprotein M-like isoform X1 [Salmo salar]
MSNEAAAPEKPGQGEINGKAKHEPSARKERPQKRGGGRFEPYGNPSKRYRVFVSNIPYDVKWQALKDLMKEKVGEVTYVEHLMDGEGKSRGCAVVEFRTEELMKKAVEKVNKHNLNGRPLKVKEDPDGVIAQRDAHRSQGGGGPPGGHGGMNMGMDRMNMERMNMDRMGPGPGAPPMVNIPPSLMNNSNIPNEIIHGLQAGKIGSTVFVANLDYKVGWKKLKEVFGMAGVVVRTDILEDKDGNSRGMGTVTFDMPIEAVQAVSMFNGQLLFNRVMHVKLDEKSLPKGDFAPPERPPALPRGLSGIGLGLGPGGQPIDATALNRGGGGMGNMGPGGMDGMGFGGGMGRMGGMDNFGGMNNMERFGPSGMGRMNEMDRGLGGSFDREFGRNDMGMSRNNFGESFERGMGSSLGMDRMSSGMDRLGGGMDRLGGMERMGMERMDRVSDLDRLGGSGFDRMGSGLDRLGPSMDRLGSGLDRMSSSVDRLGPAGFDRLGPSSLERMPAGLDFASPMGMADRMERMGTNFDRMGSAGIERFPTTGLDRMGSTMDRMGAVGVGGQFDRPAEMERGGFGGNGFGGSGGPGANARKGCQIFVRNLPFDFTWKMLKDNFNTCGIVQYADIKMENGKSKGCGVVRFDNPETAERACRTMNGYRLNGREIDVRIDRNA